MLHVHARNPDGSNTMDPAIYTELHDRLRAETDAIIQLTTGGSPRLSVEERITTVRLAPEMCSLNMGLLNFFIGDEQVFFPNHRDDIERFAREIRERDVRPELEVYSAAMIEEVAHLLSLEILEEPYAINFVLHTPTQGGHRGTPRDLLDMVERARDLPGETAPDRLLDGRDAAADHDDRPRDGPQRARRDGGQRDLPARRAGEPRTRSSSSARCGSRASSSAGRRRRTRRASCSGSEPDAGVVRERREQRSRGGRPRGRRTGRACTGSASGTAGCRRRGRRGCAPGAPRSIRCAVLMRAYAAGRAAGAFQASRTSAGSRNVSQPASVRGLLGPAHLLAAEADDPRALLARRSRRIESVAPRGASRSAFAICWPTSGTPSTASPALENASSMPRAVSRRWPTTARPESSISRPIEVSSMIPSWTFTPVPREHDQQEDHDEVADERSGRPGSVTRDRGACGDVLPERRREGP